MYVTTIECENDIYDIETEGKINLFEKGCLLYLQDEEGEEIFAINMLQVISVDLNNKIEDDGEDGIEINKVKVAEQLSRLALKHGVKCNE
jgi:hypothetical protein|nr:MAG TPA: hypothetical protein [Caudoviricetes sp.]